MSKLSKSDTDFRNAITQRFINLRLETGLTQSQFAQLHEIDRQQVNRWESFTTERGVSVYTIKKFCDILKISIKDFFDDPVFA